MFYKSQEKEPDKAERWPRENWKNTPCQSENHQNGTNHDRNAFNHVFTERHASPLPEGWSLAPSKYQFLKVFHNVSETLPGFHTFEVLRALLSYHKIAQGSSSLDEMGDDR